MTTWRGIGIALTLWLGASACDNREVVTASGPVPAEPMPLPPPFHGNPPPESLIPVERDKELLVTSRAVLDAHAGAAWSFRHLVESLAAPLDASAFVRTWLASWESTSTSAAKGSLPLSVRSDVRTELVCPWLKLTPANECDATCSKCTAENLDLARAPFRLLAIVNRLDLAETPDGCDENASELRFVFIALRPGTTAALSFNVIFEYGAKGTLAGDATAWHALLPRSGEEYVTALEQLTRSVTDRKITSLKQLRTSENLGTARGTSWELRQFERADGWLVPSPLTNTARDAIDGTSQLSDHLEAHPSEIMSGNNAITSDLSTAISTMPRADFRWTDPRGSTQGMDLFGLSTCNGCHAGHRGDTTLLPFSHVGVDERGDTVISRFLDGDELSFRERSLVRRLTGGCGSPDASYAGRHGGGGGLEKLPMLGRGIARVH